MDIIENIQNPLGDSEIHKYLPDCPIYTTQELKKFTNINQILKKPIDYCIILFQDSENTGHWVCLLKYHNIIEFFDSYGQSPDEVYNYTPKNIRQSLGIENNHLTNLLKKSKFDIIYNTEKYQHDNKNYMDINTCGRHCIYRILNLIGKGKTAPEYFKFMKQMKNKFKIPYDIIVSNLIDK